MATSTKRIKLNKRGHNQVEIFLIMTVFFCRYETSTKFSRLGDGFLLGLTFRHC